MTAPTPAGMAEQTPLVDLLRNIPRDAVYQWESDRFCHHSSPIGLLAHRAAEALAALAPVAAEGGEAGCAEPQVGKAIYERIEKLIGATPGTSQARELEYLKHLTESVEELGGFDGPVSDPPPIGLVDHFKSMQRMATAYLMPEGYTDNTGASASAKDREARDELFISDMIYMLDGPEERAALRTEPTGGGEG